MVAPRVWASCLGLALYYADLLWRSGKHSADEQCATLSILNQTLGLGHLGFFIYLLSHGVLAGSIVKWLWTFTRDRVRRYDGNDLFLSLTDPDGFLLISLEVFLGLFVSGSHVLRTWCQCTDPTRPKLATRVGVVTAVPTMIAIIAYVTTKKHFSNEIRVRVG